MYEIFKTLLESAEKIGKVETAELSKYQNGWIDIHGTVESGEEYHLSFRVEEKNGD